MSGVADAGRQSSRGRSSAHQYDRQQWSDVGPMLPAGSKPGANASRALEQRSLAQQKPLFSLISVGPAACSARPAWLADVAKTQPVINWVSEQDTADRHHGNAEGVPNRTAPIRAWRLLAKLSHCGRAILANPTFMDRILPRRPGLSVTINQRLQTDHSCDSRHSWFFFFESSTH